MIQIIKELITKVIKKIYPELMVPKFEVEFGDGKFGDYSTNAALVLGKKAGERPEEIAKKIIEQIKINKIIEKAEVAKPGFINFKIALPYLQNQISEVLNAGEEYGNSDLGKDLKVNIEFISANPTGPLTVGNSRGGVIGDVLANAFLAIGWNVTREYYFNDEGGQIDSLGHSILKDKEGQYRGDYIDKLSEKITSKDYHEAGKQAAKEIINWIKKTTKNMGINFDVWFAEGADLREKGKIQAVINLLTMKNLAYKKDNAIWFRSTEFGDDKDRVLIKSSGEPTYFTSDAAYHQNKFEERKFDRVIDIWGADHHGDVARIKGFVKVLDRQNDFEIVMHQFVRIVLDGKEVRMSKRTGQFIAVDDLLKEVGRDVYRFFMLTYDINSHLNFDLKLAKEKSQKNPVYYVQYAYARICSIIKKFEALNPKFETNSKSQITKLIKEGPEISLIKELIKLPDIVIDTAEDYQVQRLPYYAIELARKFHNFYENCRVISEEKELTTARIKLIKATQIVLKKTLDLMGISAPEKM